MAKRRSIAIAGAGIGGLAAAALLAREGHEVTLFDQFDAPAPVGSGLVLQETGLTVLAALDRREDIESLGAPLHRLYGKTARTDRVVLDVRYAALRDGLKGLAVQRQALFDTVYDAALAAGASLETGTHIEEADLHLGALTDDTGRRFGPFDLIVDALGVRSPLSSAPKHALPYGALWATLPWPEGGVFSETALEQRYRAARKMAGVMPSGRATGGAAPMATYFWSIRADQYDAFRKTPLRQWKDEAAALWPETEALLRHIKSHDDLTFTRYRHRTHWPCAAGRLVHLGDSWHAASPQLGQGANNALLDAYALAAALRQSSADVADALQSYKRMRAGHVRLFQLFSFLFTPVYQSDSTLLPLLRDQIAAPLSRVPPAPQLLAAMVSGALGAPLKKLGLAPGV